MSCVLLKFLGGLVGDGLDQRRAAVDEGVVEAAQQADERVDVVLDQSASMTAKARSRRSWTIR
jgi:hypothetical protein